MNPKITLVGLILLSLGCSPSKDLDVATPATTGQAPASQTTTGSGETPTKPASTVTAEMSSDNPNRAFQLRGLQHALLKINHTTVDAWLMDTEPKREEGMMFLTKNDVKDNQGMLFVFRDIQMNDGKHGFWMKNTILPLDIVYIAADHKALNIQKGMPFNETSLAPAAAYQYVLELKQGQSEKLGIKPGTLIAVPPTIKALE